MGFNSLPNEWLDYSNVGSPIANSRFIAFKVPLKEQICANLNDKRQRFTPKDLLQVLASRNFKLRCIIDLTLTTRYYDSSFFISHKIQYEKLKMEGQGKVPPDDIVNEFFKIVDDFIQNNDDDTLIGVHCTHGVNRTGYLICRYLIDRLGWDPKEAVDSFEKARGHPFDHESYRSSLLTGNANAMPETALNTEKTDAEKRVKMYSQHQEVYSRDWPFAPMPVERHGPFPELLTEGYQMNSHFSHAYQHRRGQGYQPGSSYNNTNYGYHPYHQTNSYRPNNQYRSDLRSGFSSSYDYSYNPGQYRHDNRSYPTERNHHKY